MRAFITVILISVAGISMPLFGVKGENSLMVQSWEKIKTGVVIAKARHNENLLVLSCKSSEPAGTIVEIGRDLKVLQEFKIPNLCSAEAWEQSYAKMEVSDDIAFVVAGQSFVTVNLLAQKVVSHEHMEDVRRTDIRLRPLDCAPHENGNFHWTAVLLSDKRITYYDSLGEIVGHMDNELESALTSGFAVDCRGSVIGSLYMGDGKGNIQKRSPTYKKGAYIVDWTAHLGNGVRARTLAMTPAGVGFTGIGSEDNGPAVIGLLDSRTGKSLWQRFEGAAGAFQWGYGIDIVFNRLDSTIVALREGFSGQILFRYDLKGKKIQEYNLGGCTFASDRRNEDKWLKKSNGTIDFSSVCIENFSSETGKVCHLTLPKKLQSSISWNECEILEKKTLMNYNAKQFGSTPYFSIFVGTTLFVGMPSDEAGSLWVGSVLRKM